MSAFQIRKLVATVWCALVASISPTAWADTSPASKPSGKNSAPTQTGRLAPFVFHVQPSWLRDNDLGTQKINPVCKDFLAHLNHPRSNSLFKPDGSLVKETGTIKSVIWETLDKTQYRQGFMAMLEDYHGQAYKDVLQQFESPDWVLQRALTRPEDAHVENGHLTTPPWTERWLYRLTTSKQYIREFSDRPFGPTPVLRLMTWFPDSGTSWFGDDTAKPLTQGRHGDMSGGRIQWINHQGTTYVIHQYVLGEERAPQPKSINIDIHAVIIDHERQQAFFRQACSLRTPYRP